jgi:hypothetical protein
VIRTHNLLIRSQMLYPIELRVPKDPQANAKVREVKQTGNRKTMLRDWYLWVRLLYHYFISASWFSVSSNQVCASALS